MDRSYEVPLIYISTAFLNLLLAWFNLLVAQSLVIVAIRERRTYASAPALSHICLSDMFIKSQAFFTTVLSFVLSCLSPMIFWDRQSQLFRLSVAVHIWQHIHRRAAPLKPGLASRIQGWEHLSAVLWTGATVVYSTRVAGLMRKGYI